MSKSLYYVVCLGNRYAIACAAVVKSAQKSKMHERCHFKCSEYPVSDHRVSRMVRGYT